MPSLRLNGIFDEIDEDTADAKFPGDKGEVAPAPGHCLAYGPGLGFVEGLPWGGFLHLFAVQRKVACRRLLAAKVHRPVC